MHQDELKNASAFAAAIDAYSPAPVACNTAEKDSKVSGKWLAACVRADQRVCKYAAASINTSGVHDSACLGES
jgi:hypothetical protein